MRARGGKREAQKKREKEDEKDSMNVTEEQQERPSRGPRT